MKKDLIGYEGVYEIDQDGNIYSVKRTFVNRAGRNVTMGGNLRKPTLRDTGYYQVTLSVGNKTKSHRYHRLVAESLIPNPKNKPYVNHLDGDKGNNHPSNLEWVTAEENTKHAVENGLFNTRGVDNPACRFTYEDVVDWYFLMTHGLNIKTLSEEYGCDRNTIVRLVKRELGNVLPKYNGKPRWGYSSKDA